MGIRLIRKNSDVPNVSNKDDASMVRYAYGGYDGFVQKKGTELSYSTNGSRFTINSGVINVQGWEIEIDSSGWSMTVNSSDATKKYFVIYCEVNISLDGTAEIKSVYDTAGFPTIPMGDDLTTTTNGTARLPLYQFTAQNGIISNVSKIVSKMPYCVEEISIIKQRLDEMGFREASVENGEISINADFADAGTSRSPSPQIEIVKMAKMAVMKRLIVRTHKGFNLFTVDGFWYVNAGGTIGEIASGFRPIKECAIDVTVSVYREDVSSETFSGLVTIKVTGEMVFGFSGRTDKKLTVSAKDPITIIGRNAGWELP